MAALGWLLNLDFAGGGGADPVIPGGANLATYSRQRRRYAYGYRYIWRPVWTSSILQALSQR